MNVRELLSRIPDELIVTVPATASALEAEVKGLCANSHACQPGDVFVGLPGTRVDGGEFWPSAIASGAIAALISPQALERRPPSETESPCLVTLADMAIACAEVATAFYDYPAEAMTLAGVTGTNGKTTTTHLIEFLLQQATLPTALLGTLYTRWPGYQRTALHTTPFAIDLQADLAAARQAGCRHGVLEVSSHALAQHRVWGCPFDVAVFTNLSQDHLDFHRDLDDYFNAKARLFSPDYLRGRAIVNGRDPYGQRLLARLDPAQVWRYAVADDQADLSAHDLQYHATGVTGTLRTPLGTLPFTSPLVGQFNLENLLAAVGAVLHLGVPLATVVDSLQHFPRVPGRMERVQLQLQQDISVIVDYAHTPDSLQNSLQAARPFVPGRLICVFGCGGDRDRRKRPQMGRIAYDLADVVVVTSDNPRTEDPEAILQDILAGIPEPLAAEQVVCDRKAAIHQAIHMAQPGDGILIAGKGHEDYQILGTEKIHFDDREQARQALAQRYGTAAPSG
ncbi:UDP-N-acetylmuramoylalanyl-D-glutamate--2,6-diaminopimelate ligase [Halomicronema hongdechloris C2206]|uniref:UDP-N-acetylmuramoyl-L-alanyl-D-glutamate--2,6-diaminopimelate ligase n=1 Tax=Halomicronema hongdechloris C2206 TaxID=1641165 RepID=A0A1Z3HSU3_9CYAN|nr:UDP-N-acetylmuramoyl-L-alanyl-D-glutamate--2,6-diaminopimelate ligase [Halomicronema hongdechloris]ASC73332.1 UDP-N-acetylmuramoylalanyl-D-glutamate--2,6-diaminopimelate ligase [Halomicronema hongdechloris C2206]